MNVVMSNEWLGSTSLQGYMPEGVTYLQLVQVFGQPNQGDGEKVDAEWRGTINGNNFTIYNYKTGKVYLGRSGLPREKIKGSDWHIGGDKKITAQLVIDYFEENSR